MTILRTTEKTEDVYKRQDFVSGLFLSNQVGDRIKRKVRIALPTFITAFIPSRLIDDFNRYFATQDVYKRQPHQSALRRFPGKGLPLLQPFPFPSRLPAAPG